MPTIPFTIVCTAEDGHSYFQLSKKLLNPANIGFISDNLSPNHAFLGASPSQEQDWHNPAKRIWVIVLSGIMQIETSRSDLKNFGPGEILLLEDLTGRGHKTRSLSGEPVHYLAIQ